MFAVWVGLDDLLTMNNLTERGVTVKFHKENQTKENIFNSILVRN